LIETREQFSRYQDFLSSDYLLERVKTDPEKVAKRLGDGCYEQKLVTDQITALTGQQYSSDYTSELEQYKALMDNAATFAQEYHLTLGVALTEEQMAALTSDIVWLVEQVINGQ
ncbi:S-layer family protein, partial [Acetonema longum]